ncbi:hypothetical protein SFIMM107S_01148 [Streptomyces griseus]
MTSPYWAAVSRVSGSRASGTSTVAPAGTVTDVRPSEATLEPTVEPSLPVTPATFSESFTGLPLVLVYGTATVVRSLVSCGQLKVPPWTAGAPSTGVRIARSTSRRPPPVSRTSPGTALCAEETRAALICWAVHSGWRCFTTAAAPATCGAAIDVPDMERYACEPRPSAAAAEIATPGAAISGLRVCETIAGPRLEKFAVESSRSTAPTVSTPGAQPGEETVFRDGPRFPAATTNNVPLFLPSSVAARLIGSVQSVGSALPRLMETTSAFWSTAHSMPAMIQEAAPDPVSLRTLPTSRSVPGATPLFFPSLAAPEPPTVDATWVPWPWKSPVPAESVKFSDAVIRPWRSGCSASAPVSRTATLVPVPS